MSLIFAFFIGLAVNLDNLLIGMSLGLSGASLPLLSNLLISATSGLFALIPAFLARLVFSAFLDTAETIGAGLMICYGLWCLKDACDPSRANPADTEANAEQIQSASASFGPGTTLFKPASGRRLWFLSILLAINCIPPAISAGAFLLPPPAVGFFCFFFSFITLWLGSRLGRRLKTLPCSALVRCLPHLAALLLIVLGYAQLWL